MTTLEDVIQNYEISDVRAAFYYLSRYLKQADYFEKYEKDFFEDDYRSAPTEIAKNLTHSLIKFIEGKAGKKASEFGMREYRSWMREINSVESELDPEPSIDVKQSADQMIEDIFPPEIGKNNKQNT